MSTESKQAAESKEAASPKQDPRDFVLALLVGALLSPFTGILRALTYQLLWSWFLVQYGEGPSLQSWFGISVLYSLSVSLTQSQGTSEEPPKHVVWRVVERAVFSLLTLGAVIVAAAMARVVWGWR